MGQIPREHLKAPHFACVVAKFLDSVWLIQGFCLREGQERGGTKSKEGESSNSTLQGSAEVPVASVGPALSSVTHWCNSGQNMVLYL